MKKIMNIDDLLVQLTSIKKQLGIMNIRVDGQLVEDFEDNILIDEDTNSINFVKFVPKKETCNHRDCNGKLTIDYDSSYEMRNSDMHCVQCGKFGSREEFQNNKI